MCRPAFRTSSFSLAIVLLFVPVPVHLAHAVTLAAQSDGATGGTLWPVMLLLAAFALTAFVGRGRNRGEA